ncbi:MAG: YidC/Oxa1 family membrane protein insertase [Acidobacteriota bacterium]|nr:YidC/Oxa1 family membrane protein insertase [Acidobacteriota bacterium]
MIHLVSLLHAAATTTTTVAKTSHSSGSILDPIAKPLAWVLAGIYSVIPNYGVAIMGLSLLWMVIISPLTLKSTRSMLAMQKLQPELKKLQQLHKDDRQAFAQAQMDLFREHNVSPFGSCLPMLLPLPVFFALFRVIDGLSHTVTKDGVVTAMPKYLDSHTKMYHSIQAAHGHLVAFGMDLSKGALSPHNGILAAAPFWIALLVMAGTSYLQSAMMMNRNQASANVNPQMRMMKYFAPLFALFCIKFPAGVIVYYATSNICRIVQQDAMYRFDPKVRTLVAQEVVEVEELTHEIDERERQRPGYTPPRRAQGGGGGAAPAPKGGQAGGRSRFRDLLAQAADQQRAQQEARQKGAPEGQKGGGSGAQKNGTGKAGGGGSSTNRNPTNRANGTPNSGGKSNGVSNADKGMNGSTAGKGGANGRGAGGPANRPPAGRPNRKRRGR